MGRPPPSCPGPHPWNSKYPTLICWCSGGPAIGSPVGRVEATPGSRGPGHPVCLPRQAAQAVHGSNTRSAGEKPRPRLWPWPSSPLSRIPLGLDGGMWGRFAMSELGAHEPQPPLCASQQSRSARAGASSREEAGGTPGPRSPHARRLAAGSPEVAPCRRVRRSRLGGHHLPRAGSSARAARSGPSALTHARSR